MRISISSPTLGDVEVDEESLIGFRDADAERRAVSALLDRALGKLERAYELEPRAAD